MCLNTFIHVQVIFFYMTQYIKICLFRSRNAFYLQMICGNLFLRGSVFSETEGENTFGSIEFLFQLRTIVTIN